MAAVSGASTRLLVSESWNHFLDSTVLPWLQKANSRALEIHQPVAVIAPSLTWIREIKQLALRNKIGLLGVQFWLPSHLRRRMLHEENITELALDGATAHFLISSAALEKKDSYLGKSLAADPEIFWRVADSLRAAGIKKEPWPSEVRDILVRFDVFRKTAGFKTSHEIESLLVQKEPFLCFESLLIIGFGGEHWPTWQLLQQAVYRSKDSTVCFIYPRPNAERTDMIWNNSWEEAFGEMEILKFSPPSLQKREPFIFHVGATPLEEAEAVTLQIADFFKTGRVEKMAVVIPSGGILSQHISTCLEKAGIPHYNSLGRTLSPNQDTLAWQAVLSWWEAPSISGLMEILRNTSFFSLPLKLADIEKEVNKSITKTLSDDISLLHFFLEKDDRNPALAVFFKHWVSLPEEASLEYFLNQVEIFLKGINWGIRLQAVSALKQLFNTCGSFIISRKTFLKWLRAQMETIEKSRSELGNHPFSKVAILPYHEAAGLPWSHIILTGLNEGVWPPSEKTNGWLDEETINRFNQALIRQGKQGAGHDIVQEKCSLILGSTERRAFQQFYFNELLQHPHIALTCSTTDETGAGLTPSENITNSYAEQHQRWLDEKELHLLLDKTQNWLNPSYLGYTKLNSFDPSATVNAYQKRRDEETPFGPFDFTCSTSPEHSLTLSCKEWERALKHPELTWMNRFLGVIPIQDLSALSYYNISRGTWVHHWLQYSINPQNSKTWVARPEENAAFFQLNAAAEKTKNEVKAIYRRLTIPPWWESGWRDALWCAENLLKQIMTLKNWRFALTEWALPADCMWNEKLVLKGKLDLLLASEKTEKLLPASVLIADYKTSGNHDFKTKDLHKGNGLQLALYGLAASILDSKEVQLSFVQRWKTILIKDGVNFSELDYIWQGLSRMSHTGIFGMRNLENSDAPIQSKTLPLATLEVDPDILERKWKRTHPDLAV